MQIKFRDFPYKVCFNVLRFTVSASVRLGNLLDATRYLTHFAAVGKIFLFWYLFSLPFWVWEISPRIRCFCQSPRITPFACLCVCVCFLNLFLHTFLIILSLHTPSPMCLLIQKLSQNVMIAVACKLPLSFTSKILNFFKKPNILRYQRCCPYQRYTLVIVTNAQFQMNVCNLLKFWSRHHPSERMGLLVRSHMKSTRKSRGRSSISANCCRC